MEEMFKYLGSIYPLSDECISHLRKIVQSRKFQKGEVLLKIGEVNRNLYFIKTGVLHCHYYVKHKSVSAWFFWEGDTVVSISSFYSQTPSVDCIEPLEDGEVFYITKEDFDYLYETFNDFNRLTIRLLIKYLVEFEAHGRLIRKYSTSERYQQLLAKKPELVQRVPIKLLASWLNMEKETLSRGRSRKSSRKK